MSVRKYFYLHVILILQQHSVQINCRPPHRLRVVSSRYRRHTTPTDASEQNNTEPLCGPVIILVTATITVKEYIQFSSHATFRLLAAVKLRTVRNISTRVHICMAYYSV